MSMGQAKFNPTKSILTITQGHIRCMFAIANIQFWIWRTDIKDASWQSSLCGAGTVAVLLLAFPDPLTSHSDHDIIRKVNWS